MSGEEKRAATEREVDLELLGCLTLVVPAGMDRQRRIEWVEIARQTVKHLPLDLLRAGCEEARKRADHPAKIVPAILAAAEPLLRSRRETTATPIIPVERRVEPPIEDIPIEEIRSMPRHMAEMGLRKGWITQTQFDRAFDNLPNGDRG